MFVKVRTMDGKSSAAVTISKMTTVDEFRKLLQEQLDVAPEYQRLFFRGKQVCALSDLVWNIRLYKILHNNIFLLMVFTLFCLIFGIVMLNNSLKMAKLSSIGGSIKLCPFYQRQGKT